MSALYCRRINFDPSKQHPTSFSNTTNCNIMTSSSQEDSKPDGAAFDDYFESLGKKAEDLRINEQDVKSATNSASAPDSAALEDDKQKIVDEIESLCMNCHENVYFSKITYPSIY
jgi:hypothetical protein